MTYDKVIDIVKSTKSIVFDDTLRNNVQLKGYADFVTAVDTGISNYLKSELQKLYPDYGFFSEEEESYLSDPCWILDPIDGTTNLVYGYKQCAVSLGLYKDGEIVFGIVYNPFTDECFYAYKGLGAYMNGEKLKVSKRTFKDSLVEFGASSYFKENTNENFDLAKRIFTQVVDLRRICSAALTLCYIAQGRIDGYFEKVLKPWDYAAGSLILTEAGGILSDYTGSSIRYNSPTTMIAGNKNTHKELLKTIQEFYKI